MNKKIIALVLGVAVIAALFYTPRPVNTMVDLSRPPVERVSLEPAPEDPPEKRKDFLLIRLENKYLNRAFTSKEILQTFHNSPPERVGPLEYYYKERIFLIYLEPAPDDKYKVIRIEAAER